MIWLNFWAPDHLWKNLPMKNLWKVLAAWMRTHHFLKAWKTGTKMGRRKRSPRMRKSPIGSKEGGHFSLSCCGFGLHTSQLWLSQKSENPAGLTCTSCWPRSLRSHCRGDRVTFCRSTSLTGHQTLAGSPEMGGRLPLPLQWSQLSACQGLTSRERLPAWDRCLFLFPSPILHSCFPSEFPLCGCAVKINWNSGKNHLTIF